MPSVAPVSEVPSTDSLPRYSDLTSQTNSLPAYDDAVKDLPSFEKADPLTVDQGSDQELEEQGRHSIGNKSPEKLSHMHA